MRTFLVLVFAATFLSCQPTGTSVGGGSDSATASSTNQTTRSEQSGGQPAREPAVLAKFPEWDASGAYVLKGNDVRNALAANAATVITEAEINALLQLPAGNGPGGPVKGQALGQFTDANGRRSVVFAYYMQMLDFYSFHVACLDAPAGTQPAELGDCAAAQTEIAPDRIMLSLSKGGAISVEFGTFERPSESFTLRENGVWMPQ
jgi:hypothetical protein